MTKRSCVLLINIKAPVIDRVISSQQDEGTHLTSLSGLFGFQPPPSTPHPPLPNLSEPSVAHLRLMLPQTAACTKHLAWLPVFLTHLICPVSVVLISLRRENIGERHSAPRDPFCRKGQVSAELRDV